MYPATQNTGTLVNLIKAIGSHGIPTKFTTKELPVWGYKSSHDRPVVSVLKFIGFLDGNGAPTDLWREARTKPDSAVGKGVRSGYAELFATFPDADRKDSESLTNFFKAKTAVSEAGVKQMVNTFKALAQIGSFDGSEVGETESPSSAQANSQSNTKAIQFSTHATNGLSVNMNIELSLPADTTGEIYDKFFAAMKKHLFNAGD